MASQTSIIAAGTVIRGRIRAEGDLEIHGHVEGGVAVDGSVTIGADALVKSDVEAHSVLVAGAVAGNLRGDERVVLEDGARVVGDVTAPTIGIRPGARLRGRVATGEAPARATEASRSAVAAKPTAAAKPAPKPAAAPRAEVRPAARQEPSRAAAQEARSSLPPVTRPAQSSGTSADASSRGGKEAPATRTAAAPAATVATTAKRPPEPVVPALQKRTKKAVKRRAR